MTSEQPIHLRDTRRPLGFYPGQDKPAQVPVICAADVIPLAGSRFTIHTRLVTCPDCVERIEAAR